MFAHGVHLKQPPTIKVHADPSLLEQLEKSGGTAKTGSQDEDGDSFEDYYEHGDKFEDDNDADP